jgi:putative acetyltransferase
MAVAVAIRAERPGDRAAIFAVHAAAFPTDAEARLVDRLRDAGAATVSLVAESDGRVVGHNLFSPVRIVGPGGAESGAIGLAPVAVLPALQNGDVGGALIRAGFEACRAAGHAVVFVLGHPPYYPRFGFEPAARFGLSYEGRPQFSPAFFVRELEPGALAGRSGVVHYHVEFAGL